VVKLGQITPPSSRSAVLGKTDISTSRTDACIGAPVYGSVVTVAAREQIAFSEAQLRDLHYLGARRHLDD
jgi:hypothetical protein